MNSILIQTKVLFYLALSAKRESERDGFQATRIFKSPEGERLKHSCIMVFCKSITKIKQEVQIFSEIV